ncbi:MAG: GatB/YqeY domain-containing protein [Thermodesulfobacteriota bacterium]
MSLQQTIQDRLHTKNISQKEKDALRVVIGEMQRQKSKTLNDQEVVKILKKLATSERELGERRDKEYLQILESFLPQEATAAEITTWIKNNIDFDQYNNKMQAMRDILNHFGPRTDGNTVKTILTNQF